MTRDRTPPADAHLIRTLDVCLEGRRFVVAFRSWHDADRFLAFVEAHAAECPQADPSTVYRLDREWSLGQYGHRPLYAIPELDAHVIFTMASDLFTTRLRAGAPESEPPEVTCDGTPEHGITFDVKHLPSRPLN